MEWINLAKRQPAIQGKPIIIKTYDGDNTLDVFWVTDYKDLVEKWNRYEWLDETSVDEKTMKLLYGSSNSLNIVDKVLNNKDVAKEWLKKVGISPNAVVDDRVKTFPEEFLRYELWELLTLYHIHITKTNQ